MIKFAHGWGQIPKMQGWAITSSKAAYFENAPTLGLYPTLIVVQLPQVDVFLK
jgi:hypothetical protein